MVLQSALGNLKVDCSIPLVTKRLTGQHRLSVFTHSVWAGKLSENRITAKCLCMLDTQNRKENETPTCSGACARES